MVRIVLAVCGSLMVVVVQDQRQETREDPQLVTRMMVKERTLRGTMPERLQELEPTCMAVVLLIIGEELGTTEIRHLLEDGTMRTVVVVVLARMATLDKRMLQEQAVMGFNVPTPVGYRLGMVVVVVALAGIPLATELEVLAVEARDTRMAEIPKQRRTQVEELAELRVLIGSLVDLGS